MDGSAAKAVKETFYFALFSEADMTNAVYMDSLKLSKESEGSITFTELPYGTYYIAETDKKGKVGEDFKYKPESVKLICWISRSWIKTEST